MEENKEKKVIHGCKIAILRHTYREATVGECDYVVYSSLTGRKRGGDINRQLISSPGNN